MRKEIQQSTWHPQDHEPRTYLVRLAASGDLVGIVHATSRLEALGRACVLATMTGYRPQRLDVRPANVGEA